MNSWWYFCIIHLIVNHEISGYDDICNVINFDYDLEIIITVTWNHAMNHNHCQL